MSEELASVKGIVNLTPREALDRARAFLMRQGYRPVHRTDTYLIVERFRPGRVFRGEVLNLSVTASPQLGGGVKIAVEGNDGEGLRERQAKWIEWAESLPKKESEKRASLTAPDLQSAGGDSATETERKEPTLEAMSSAAEAPEKTSASPDAPGQQPGDPGQGTRTGREFHGTTVEEAVAVASAALGMKEEEIFFEVVDRGSRGFLGAGERHARIKLKTVERSGEERGSGLSESEEAEENDGMPVGANEEDYYYTPGQAVQMLGKDAYEINQMIYQEKLPVVRVNGYRWIPAQAIENLLPRKSRRRLKNTAKPHRVRMPEKRRPEKENPLTDSTSSQESGDYPTNSAPTPKASSPGSEKFEGSGGEGSAQEVSEPQNAVHNLIRVLKDLERKRFKEKDIEDESSLSKRTDASVQRVKELEDEVRALRVTLRADREYWERELEREREGRKQDNFDARYEIDQLDAELENLHRDDRILRAELEEERSWKADSERRAEELQAELDEERSLRLTAEEPLGSTALEWHERDEYEERLAALSFELEEERKKLPKREEWVLGLQSRLEESEAEKKALEEALLSEKEKARRLEADRRVLEEVRRLLRAEAAQPSSLAEIDAAPESPPAEESDGASGKLLIKTQHGQWVFRPPFVLEDEEVQLLRLVAGENEITADQIKHRAGRRRAADDLDDLLDRLADEGLEPITENNDRYSFDPDFMQD